MSSLSAATPVDPRLASPAIAQLLTVLTSGLERDDSDISLFDGPRSMAMAVAVVVAVRAAAVTCKNDHQHTDEYESSAGRHHASIEHRVGRSIAVEHFEEVERYPRQ